MSSEVKFNNVEFNNKFLENVKKHVDDANCFDNSITQNREQNRYSKVAIVAVVAASLLALAAISLLVASGVSATGTSLPQAFHWIKDLGFYNYIIGGSVALVAATILIIASIALNRTRTTRKNFKADIEAQREIYNKQLDEIEKIFGNNFKTFNIPDGNKNISWADNHAWMDGNSYSTTRLANGNFIITHKSKGELRCTQELTEQQCNLLESFFKAIGVVRAEHMIFHYFGNESLKLQIQNGNQKIGFTWDDNFIWMANATFCASKLDGGQFLISYRLSDGTLLHSKSRLELKDYEFLKDYLTAIGVTEATQGAITHYFGKPFTQFTYQDGNTEVNATWEAHYQWISPNSFVVIPLSDGKFEIILRQENGTLVCTEKLDLKDYAFLRSCLKAIGIKQSAQNTYGHFFGDHFIKVQYEQNSLSWAGLFGWMDADSCSSTQLSNGKFIATYKTETGTSCTEELTQNELAFIKSYVEAAGGKLVEKSVVDHFFNADFRTVKHKKLTLSWADNFTWMENNTFITPPLANKELTLVYKKADGNLVCTGALTPQGHALLVSYLTQTGAKPSPSVIDHYFGNYFMQFQFNYNGIDGLLPDGQFLECLNKNATKREADKYYMVLNRGNKLTCTKRIAKEQRLLLSDYLAASGAIKSDLKSKVIN